MVVHENVLTKSFLESNDNRVSDIKSINNVNNNNVNNNNVNKLWSTTYFSQYSGRIDNRVFLSEIAHG